MTELYDVIWEYVYILALSFWQEVDYAFGKITVYFCHPIGLSCVWRNGCALFSFLLRLRNFFSFHHSLGRVITKVCKTPSIVSFIYSFCTEKKKRLLHKIIANKFQQHLDTCTVWYYLNIYCKQRRRKTTTFKCTNKGEEKKKKSEFRGE